MLPNCDVEVAHSEDRRDLRAQQGEECVLHGLHRYILDLKKADEQAVDRHVDGIFHAARLCQAHAPEVHECGASDEHFLAVDDGGQAAAFVAGEIFKRHERAVVALHEIGKYGGKAAAG